MITETLTAISALFFVLALLGLGAWALKRFGLAPGQPRLSKGAKQINILDSKLLDSKNRLVAVEWKGKEYLLATGANGVTPISISKSEFAEMVREHEET